MENAFEHIADLDQVKTYLETHAPSLKKPLKDALALPDALGELCQPEGCDLWRAEAILVAAIEEELKKEKPNQENINHLRELIRAVSWRLHERPQKERLVADAVAWKNMQQDRSPEEQKRANGIVRALEDERLSEDTEEAVRAIEWFVDEAWKKIRTMMEKRQIVWKDLAFGYLKHIPHAPGSFNGEHAEVNALLERLHHLRPIRDQLYFQRLYPNWMKTTKST